MTSIDAEWLSFLQSQSSGLEFGYGLSAGDAVRRHAPLRKLSLDNSDDECEDRVVSDDETVPVIASTPPVCGELYISTKTKVLFLNQRDINLAELFWNLPITEYWRPEECIVKKQMKIVSNTQEEYDALVEKLKTVPYYTEHAIKQINNPTARRVKFKDQRKITIGVSKKDIMNCRGKIKKAFDNCFAIIIRFRYEEMFREIHVKVFTTGKLEIPGILNADILAIVRTMILRFLQPYFTEPLAFIENDVCENVLINSNFNCGFYINRERLYTILRSDKYDIETSYDPCIYPGIKCKFYFNTERPYDHSLQNGTVLKEDRSMKLSELNDAKKYIEVSFMIFRTGSCLIVGNCNERVLQFIYEFIRDMLTSEYASICVATDETAVKNKKPKLRKKNVSISSEYYNEITA